MEYPDELRFVTYLSPSIPLAFFEAVVEHVRLVLGNESHSWWNHESRGQ